MPDLSWRHHALIQTLLSRGPLKEEEFNSIFAVVSGKPQGTNKKEFSDYLLKINKELAFVQFELRGCRNQYDGKVYYGVVNNVADEQAKFGTKYTVPQIAFYKCIVRSQSPSGTSTVPYAFRNFTISKKDKTIDELVQDRWLCSIPDGKIGLGVGSFLNLRSWFRGNDAELCQKEDCKIRIHHYCLKKKFSQRMAGKVCPSCGTEWPSGSTFEAAKEVDGEEEDRGEPSQYQVAQPSSTEMRKKRRSVKSERADTVGEDRRQISEPELRRSSRSSTQRR
ncbi:hypothetical protein MKW94_008523 [Papaver nudicaule]|uniref:Non-structural maintenance of chromosomes element 1 homolog n=1 Tax=Papaver nudicaule TaxID=74823 RepID=A0AA41VYJ5_PAPNU|nr:hypothetical protein [Papaver nudicaule]